MHKQRPELLGVNPRILRLAEPPTTVKQEPIIEQDPLSLDNDDRLSEEYIEKEVNPIAEHKNIVLHDLSVNETILLNTEANIKTEMDEYREGEKLIQNLLDTKPIIFGNQDQPPNDDHGHYSKQNVLEHVQIKQET